MADMPHITYNGASKVIRRLCEIVNALADGGGGADIDVDDALSGVSENPVQNRAITAAINALSERLDAIQETIGVVPGLAASVENDVLVITGGGAAVKGNHLLLVSGDVTAFDNILHFGGDTVRADVENNVLSLDGASVADNCAVIVSPGASVRDNVLYL